MKYLVFGGTRFVSWYIVKKLYESGNEVITINRGNCKGLHGNNITEIYADRHNFNELKSALDEVEVDYVIDVSGYTLNDIKYSFEAIMNKDIKGYIFISSSAVYQESEILPIKEDFPVGENRNWGNYGTDKLEAEKYLTNKQQNSKFPIIILRPPYIYGEGNNVYREAFIFDRLKEGKPIIIPYNGKCLVQFIHIDDLYQTIIQLLKKNVKGNIFNVGNCDSITLKGWVQKCMLAFGKSTEIIEFDYLTNNFNSRDFFPLYDYQYYLDVTKISEIFKPVITLEDGLQKSLKWYNQNQDLVMKRDHYSVNSDNITDLLLKTMPNS